MFFPISAESLERIWIRKKYFQVVYSGGDVFIVLDTMGGLFWGVLTGYL